MRALLYQSCPQHVPNVLSLSPTPQPALSPFSKPCCFEVWGVRGGTKSPQVILTISVDSKSRKIIFLISCQISFRTYQNKQDKT